MNLSEFRERLDELMATNSRTEKAGIIKEMSGEPAAISFLSGSEFDDAGLGKKTVLSVAQDVFGDAVDGKPTVSESLEQFGPERDGRVGPSGVRHLSALHNDMERLSERSGNDMKSYLKSMFEQYSYPSVVAHACLNDLSTGVGDSSIASALGIKDSLPFYESVVAAAADDEPLTSPEVGRPFKPMLAKSESSLPEDTSDWFKQAKLDGYRLILHVKDREARAFTRNMKDVTESLPELREINWPTNDYILDCEVIAETGSYNDTSSRVGRKGENVDTSIGMEFAIFDVIVNHGTDISHKPYDYRRVAARSFTTITPDDRVYALSNFRDLDKAKEQGAKHEGLIYKDPDAPYKFDKRSKAWVKEKHTGETIDLVAAEFLEGEARLDGTLGKIRLETADGESVGFTGSGFTDAERDEVWQNQSDYLGGTLEVEGEAFTDGVRFPIFQRWRLDDGEPDTLERVKEILPEA